MDAIVCIHLDGKAHQLVFLIREKTIFHQTTTRKSDRDLKSLMFTCFVLGYLPLSLVSTLSSGVGEQTHVSKMSHHAIKPA